MRILVLADEPDKMLWDHLDRRRLENIDLVISCGDLSASYLSFLTCFTPAPVIYIHGNHDTSYERKPPEGCTCIEDIIFVHNGVRILGLGGSMRYKPGPHQYTDKDMRWRVFKLIPQLLKHRGFDILVTHAPARALGDAQDIAHRGFETFIDLMDRFEPKYMLHGHVHKEYSHEFVRERQWKETKVINAWMSCVIEIDEPKKKSRKGQ